MSHNQKYVENKHHDDLEVNSNVADCLSDKSSKSMNEKALSYENQNN